MKIKEWVAENIVYRFFGCFYNKNNQPLFDFIATKIPTEFQGKEISDLGCGDGSNTARIEEIFKPKGIIGYDHNDHCLRRAQAVGLKVRKLDLNQEVPQGEMATFTFSLHHATDKEKVLRQAAHNFEYLFLCEPVRDLYHALVDAGKTLPKKEWVGVFDRALGHYTLYQYKSSLIVFYKKAPHQPKAKKP